MSNLATTPVPIVKEKIIFEIKSLMLPTILNLENLVTIGFVALAAIASVVFHFGLYEILIVALLFLLLAVPSFRSIFQAGSTTYVLTNQRLIIFSVGFGQKERSIPLANIISVNCKSSGLQFLYGAGDILIKQKGLRRTIRLVGLSECKKRAEQISQAAKKAAR
ncbi:MAG: PH domain-containing protein [Anaerolineaceae bacterium]|nr:PH domain-containing protein [Anaerolineaceae bacterium]